MGLAVLSLNHQFRGEDSTVAAHLFAGEHFEQQFRHFGTVFAGVTMRGGNRRIRRLTNESCLQN